MNERRCHYSSFIIHTVKTMWMFLTAIVVFIIQTGESDELLTEMSGYRLWFFLGLVALTVGAFVFNFLRWRRTFISLDEENLVVDRRTINKKKTTVKRSTISTVNIRRGILEKCFGVSRLQLDINSAATADQTDFDLIFSQKEALEIRALLLPRPETEANEEVSPEDTAAVQTAQPFQAEGRFICSFSFGQVLRHCVLSLSPGSILAALSGFIVWFWLSGDETIQNASLLPVLVMVCPALWQSVRPLFLYQNFRLTKSGKQLGVSCGLVSTQQFSLPLDKTNAIVIRRPMLARPFGLCSGEIINIGMGDSQSQQAPVFCLLTTPAEMHRILMEIAPDYATASQSPDCPRPTRSPQSALLPVMLTWALWGLVALALSVFLEKWWAGALALAFFLLCAWFQWRTKELAFFEDKLSVTTGIFSKRNITADYAKLQLLRRKCGPVSSRLGLRKGSVGILASAAYQNNNIGYFPAADFDRIQDEIQNTATPIR